MPSRQRRRCSMRTPAPPRRTRSKRRSDVASTRACLPATSSSAAGRTASSRSRPATEGRPLVPPRVATAPPSPPSLDEVADAVMRATRALRASGGGSHRKGAIGRPRRSIARRQQACPSRSDRADPSGWSDASAARRHVHRRRAHESSGRHVGSARQLPGHQPGLLAQRPAHRDSRRRSRARRRPHRCSPWAKRASPSRFTVSCSRMEARIHSTSSWGSTRSVTRAFAIA